MNGMTVLSGNGAGGNPPVLRFEATLSRQPEAVATSSGIQLIVPEWVSGQFPSDRTTVEGTINDHPFRAALEPDAPGRHRIRLNRAMLKGSDADAGDVVELAILGPESETMFPEDLRLALASSREAKSLWDDLTDMGRRDWLRWVESAKKPETRSRRISRTVEQLSEGKRRACCVNVYEFMLKRIREDEETE